MYPYLLFFGIFLSLSATALWGEGMFMDGTIYAAIARNMAEGEGSFWQPHFTETLDNEFYGHLPLGIYLQSRLFLILGDTIYTERIYALLMFLLSVVLLHKILQRTTIFFDSPPAFDLSALPFLLLITVPLVAWSVAANVLEVTLLFFVLMSIRAALQFRPGYAFLSGIFIFLAVMSKGPTALFPLSFFFWLFCFGLMSPSRFLIFTFWALVGLLLLFLIIYLFSAQGWAYLNHYNEIQLLGSFYGKSTVDSRWYILIRTAQELIPMGILVVLALWFNVKNKANSIPKKWAWTYLCLALSGVLPLLITTKQSGFYVCATFPFFALAGAMVGGPLYDKMLELFEKGKIIFRALSIFVLMLGCGLSVYSSQKYSRDADKIEDIKIILQQLPPHTTLNIQEEIKQDWSLHAYMQRYGHASLAEFSDRTCPFLLSLNNHQPSAPNKYRDLGLPLKKYKLWLRL